VANDYAEQRDELLESIERDHEELREAVHELAEAARETLGFTDRIRESPLTWIAGAFLLGLWLGSSGRSETVPRMVEGARR